MKRFAIAVAAGLALADASVVTLALPPIAAELGTSVTGAAAVLGVYALVLALALPLAARRPPAGVLGFAVLAAASAGCGAAGSLATLIAFRALQAAGGALGLVAAFAALGRGRAWTSAAIFGTAAGPALGGALTQAFDWRAVFLAQVPVALAGAWACATADDAGATASRAAAATPAATATAARDDAGATASPAAAATPAASAAATRDDRGAPTAPAAVAALALVSAALTGVLFLLVLLLVTGWSLEPLAAAVVVSVLPVCALAAAWAGRGSDPRVRACAGAGLLGAGVLALAALPAAEPALTLLPQAVAGVGMGLALPALAGELLPERTPAEAATLLSVRHAGIVAALALLAPITSARLDDAVAVTRERGTALVLDARLPPLRKLELAGQVAGPVDPVDPRGQVRRGLRRALAGADPAATSRLEQRADDAVVAGVNSAFRPALLVCGAFGVLAALLVLPPSGRARTRSLVPAGVALALAVVALLARPSLAPQPVAIADPCLPRALPRTGGIDGAIQEEVLKALDRAACRFGSSREALVLALVDRADARRYQREYGVNPRDAGRLLGAALAP